MHKAKRASTRLALVGWLGLLGSAILGAPALAAAPPERVLPDSTIFLFKINDAKQLREAFRGSHYGQLWHDPAMKDFREDLTQKLEESARPLKEKIGVSLTEMVELPEGPVSLAVLSRDDPKLPVAFVVMADAGGNKDKMAEVMDKAMKQADQAGAKISQEMFNGQTIHILRESPEEKAKKEAQKKEGDDDDDPEIGVAWTQADSVFYITVASEGGEVDVIKDLTAHKEGRDNALAGNEFYGRIQAKLQSDKSQVVWFLDIVRVIKLALKASAKGNEGQMQQNEVYVQTFGIDGLKAAGGSFGFSSGRFDSLSKTFILAPKPVQGLLKIFSFPPIHIRPEPWVPAGVAEYRSFSWNLDHAYDAIEGLVNQFQPGVLKLIEQQLAGPNGGAPLSFKKDIFGPLGNRLTLISDFKKPVKEDSQRYLLSVALDNAKAFQESLNRIFEIAQGAPKKREFQGVTIYDVDMPQVPNPQAPGAPPIEGQLSFAVAKDSFFVTTDTALLEQVLRPGGGGLEENAAFQSVVKEMPERVSGMSFIRPEESARLLYDLIKSGQYEKALQQMMGANARGPRAGQVPDLGKSIPNEKLPDFDVIAKYLTPAGSYSLMDDDGFTITGFTLKREGP